MQGEAAECFLARRPDVSERPAAPRVAVSSHRVIQGTLRMRPIARSQNRKCRLASCSLAAIEIGAATENAGAASVDEETVRRVAALGYVSGSPSPAAVDRGLDPKDYIGVYNAMRSRARR